MIIMGIDPSINCTGICIYDTLTGSNAYYMIIGKATKKMLAFKHEYIHISTYDKQTYTNDEYSVKENKKTENIVRICALIRDIIHWYNPDLFGLADVLAETQNIRDQLKGCHIFLACHSTAVGTVEREAQSCHAESCLVHGIVVQWETCLHIGGADEGMMGTKGGKMAEGQ